MTNLIDLKVYSFSLDEAFNSKGGYRVKDTDAETEHSLYISNIYINIDAIKMAFDLKNNFKIINNDGTEGREIKISRILFSDGSGVYTSNQELMKILEFTISTST